MYSFLKCFYWNIEINLLKYKLSYLSVIWLIKPQLVFLILSVHTLVGFRFNSELGIWGYVVPPTLYCFISSTRLIDRVSTEPPPSCKRAECTALSVWQLGFLHLQFTKSKKARRKDSVIDRDRPFQNSPSLHTSHLKLSPAGSIKL